MIGKHILIIDDDDRIRSLLERYLTQKGFICSVASEGNEAIERFKNNKFDLCIIDIMLPGMDGFEILTIFRKTSNIPMIMLTARTSIDYRVKGFSLGADDYITKPFDPEELFLRIMALLRRCENYEARDHFKIDKYMFDIKNGRLKIDDKIISLENYEIKLLEFFCKKAHQIITSEKIGELLIELGVMQSFSEVEIDKIINNLKVKLSKSDVINHYPDIGYSLSAVAIK